MSYNPPETARDAANQIHEYLFNDEPVDEEIDEMERIILRLIEQREKKRIQQIRTRQR